MEESNLLLVVNPRSVFIGTLLILAACSFREDGIVPVEKEPASYTSSRVPTLTDHISGSQSVVVGALSSRSSSITGRAPLSGRWKRVQVSEFKFRVPVEWSVGKQPDGKPALYNGSSLMVSMYCPIPEWDAGLGWGDKRVSKRTFRKGEQVFKVSLERYPGPDFVLYVREVWLEEPEKARPSCAFLGRRSVGEQMEEIFASME